MYCTLQDLVDRFGETEVSRLSDRSMEGVIDELVVSQAIADAGAEIDGHLTGRYPLPLAVTPPQVKLWACDIARYRLYREEPPEHVKTNFDNAVKALRMVARGDLGLGPNDIGESAKASNQASMVSGGRVFGRETSKGFI